MRSSSSVFDSGEWRFFQPRAAGFGGSPLFSVGCDTTGGEKKEVKLRKAIAGRGDGVEGVCVRNRLEIVKQSNYDWRLISGAPVMTSSIIVGEMKRMRNG
ncbi:hypothetical protein F2Q70_00015853 [Brassica cretica]|uniref:Uncharacterized protein n=1 Tax=Brassica cretica TaxID=69181 RepID=A0A8S9HWU9_BRACR|nr:hypothetical protein F2Q70_00015853 [Brassica cretica]